MLMKKHEMVTSFYKGYKIKGEYMDGYRADTIMWIDTNLNQVYEIKHSRLKYGEWTYYDVTNNLCAKKVYDACWGLVSTEIYCAIDSSLLQWDKFDSTYIVVEK